MQPFSPFLEVCCIGPCLHVLNSFPLWIMFLNFKLFCFWLTFSHGIHVDGRQSMRTNFWVVKGKHIAVNGALKRKRTVLFLFTFKALKWNMFTCTITAYKDVIFMCGFRHSATNWYQSISNYLSIVTENWYQSITTQILVIDGSLIIHINWLIDIDCHRLSILSIGYPGIVRHMTSFVQKILVDSSHQEFVMKQTRKNVLVGIVTFDLIGVLPTITLFLTLQLMAYQILWGNLWF